MTNQCNHCGNEIKGTKISLNQRVSVLEEKTDGLKNLSAKILAKIDKLEKRGV